MGDNSKIRLLRLASISLLLTISTLSIFACSNAASETNGKLENGKGSQVGFTVPDFEMRMYDGQAVSSDEILSYGRPSFFIFVASW